MIKNAMTKSELILLVAKKGKIKKNKSELIVNTIFDSLSEALVKNQRIEIRGFGSFINRDYKGYMGRNPRTNAIISVQKKRLPFFKVGKEFQKDLND